MTTIIEQMIAEELAAANKKFPAFASTHEGWAVLFEELVETEKEVDEIREVMTVLFKDIMASHGYDELKADRISDIRHSAVRAIEELFQVAAMCDKFKALGEKKDGEDHAAQVSEYAEMVLKNSKDFNLVHDQYISPGLGNSGEPVWYGGGSTISKDTKDFLEKSEEFKSAVLCGLTYTDPVIVERIKDKARKAEIVLREIEKTTPSGDPLKMMDTLAEKGAISQEDLEAFNKNNLSKKLKNRCQECKSFLGYIYCEKNNQRVDADWTCANWEGREK